MAYIQAGKIETTDYNTLASYLNPIWGTGSGDYGYGQTPISLVGGNSANKGTGITSAQWVTLVNALNLTTQHQGVRASTPSYTISGVRYSFNAMVANTISRIIVSLPTANAGEVALRTVLNTTNPSTGLKYGDLDGGGTIDIADSIIINKTLSGLYISDANNTRCLALLAAIAASTDLESIILYGYSSVYIINPSMGNYINYLPALSAAIRSTDSNRLTSRGLYGLTTTGSINNSTWNTPASTITETLTLVFRASFDSADAVRWFFNAAGYLKFNCSAIANGTPSARSSAVVDLCNNLGGLLSFDGYNNRGRIGSGGTLNTNDPQKGYWTCSNGITHTLVSVTSTTTSYTTDTGSITVNVSGTYGSRQGNGINIDFGINLSSTSGANAGGLSFDDDINVTLSNSIDIIYPETTYLSDSWGTVNISKNTSATSFAVTSLIVVGAGGGGGGAWVSPGDQFYSGGGGGSGGYINTSLFITPGQNLSISIGAGGGAGYYGGYGVYGGNGGDGNSTSLGDIIATGGGGGKAMPSYGTGGGVGGFPGGVNGNNGGYKQYSVTAGGDNVSGYGHGGYGGGAGGDWGQAGFDGAVVISYADTYADIASISAGLTYTRTTSSGLKVYTFTSGTGTITV